MGASLTTYFSAALQNPSVMGLIDSGELSEDKERKSPHVAWRFRYGAVFARLNDGAPISYGEKKFGDWVCICPLPEWADIDPEFMTVWHSPTHPRRVRYEHRMELKKRLPKKFAPLLTLAKRHPLHRFLDRAEEEYPGSAAAIRKCLDMELAIFWRSVRKGPDAKIKLPARMIQGTLF